MKKSLQIELRSHGGRVDINASGDADIPDDPELKDYWTLTYDVLVIHHLRPRIKLFEPTEGSLPIPLKYLDVLRTTRTNLDDASESWIMDEVWYDNPDAGRELSSPWTGKTIFDLLKPKAPEGHEWQAGRLTKVQATSRPPNIRVEEW